MTDLEINNERRNALYIVMHWLIQYSVLPMYKEIDGELVADDDDEPLIKMLFSHLEELTAEHKKLDAE